MIYPGVFLPVLLGGFDYWQGWAFAVLYSLGTLAFKRRGPAGPAHEQGVQKRIAWHMGAASVFLILLPALAHRLGVCQLPWPASFLGAGLLLLGWWWTIEAFEANPYASAVVQAPKLLIAEGPYRKVRHPMYVGIFTKALGSGVLLGSWLAVFPLLYLAGVIVWRIIEEERFLRDNKPAYELYRAAVPYRLIRGVW